MIDNVFVQSGGMSTDLLVKITAGVVALMAASLPSRFADQKASSFMMDDSPDVIPLRYDPEALARYWARRPVEVCSTPIQNIPNSRIFKFSITVM